jgi:uncharacterized protein involved in exopolysaccharide biosynthesis
MARNSPRFSREIQAHRKNHGTSERKKMNRYRPRYRLPPRVPMPDPEEVAAELRAKAAEQNVARLRARLAELNQKAAKLRRKLGYNMDWP